MQFIGSTCKVLMIEELIFWQKNFNAIIFDNSVPADCLEKVVHLKTGEILEQKIRLSPRLQPKVILKCVWQGQHEGQVQQESTGETSCRPSDDNTRTGF